ncbi:MAG: hypothetical protein WCD38_12310, partial [Candidatus Tumulicola sp.]
FGGAAIFDYRVTSTGVVFHRCRYYYITADARSPARIEMVNVGISSEKMTRVALRVADREMRARLIADGWRNSVAARGWTKGDIVLELRSRRLDDPVPGEKPANAGQWIQYLELHGSRPPGG